MNDYFRFLIIAVLTAFFVWSCTNNKPIKIGFVGGLTGKSSPLGIEGRNGASLAVTLINENGGINGRKVQLITKDDKQNSEKARKVVQELIDEGVSAVIGHMTSTMSIAGAEITNQNKVVMISPTTSTGELSGIDDYFFRVYPASNQVAVQLADYLYNEAERRKLVVIFDQKNRAHSASWYTSLQTQFENLGGKVVDKIGFNTTITEKQINQLKLAVENGTDSIFILANSIDTALICQLQTLNSITVQKYSSEWSANKDIINQGGKSVEGLVFFNTFNKYSEKKEYLDFIEAYGNVFYEEPGFAAIHAYDSAMILFQALKKSSDPQALKSNILKLGTINGLQGTINFDKYGDVRRKHFLMVIKNGEFVPME